MKKARLALLLLALVVVLAAPAYAQDNTLLRSAHGPNG